MRNFKQFLKEEDFPEFNIGFADREARGQLSYYMLDKRIPKHIGKLEADAVDLTSLQGGPERVLTIFNVKDNNLRDLKGGPTHVGTYFCRNNGLTSLEGAPEFCGTFNCADNDITSLAGIGSKYLQRCNDLVLTHNPIKGRILGTLKIKDLRSLSFDVGLPQEAVKAFVILLPYLIKTERDILDAQEELLDAGLDDYARL